MLGQITPVLLTYNEDQNIVRTLSHLGWAKDVVVVDSGSTDGTLAALQSFPNVRVFNRNFDTHGNQWRYATEETKINGEWLLRLDADYQMSDALVAEMAQLRRWLELLHQLLRRATSPYQLDHLPTELRRIRAGLVLG